LNQTQLNMKLEVVFTEDCEIWKKGDKVSFREKVAKAMVAEGVCKLVTKGKKDE